VGVYLAVVQLLFALGWVVYVAYLPQLAAAAGIERRWVPWILAADQIIFIVTDLAVGVGADRAARVIGRIGRWAVAATLVSTAAFVLLPWAAAAALPGAMLALTVVWALTSSALRAPPLTLLSRHVARPALPALVALNALGLGLAQAAAPYLALWLKGLDPRWPFLLSATVLAAVSLGMVAAERALARGSAAPAGTTRPGLQPALPLFGLLCLVAAAAFQWQVFALHGPLALRFFGADMLPAVLPLFWAGFNVGLWPASLLVRRLGAFAALCAGAALAGAAAAVSPWLASGAAQALVFVAAGFGWALFLCAAFCAVAEIGRSGREGLVNGVLQASLAAAALVRIAVLASVAPSASSLLACAPWPALGFAAAAGLACLSLRVRSPPAPARSPPR
jgi:hypothetical protein